MLDHQTAQERRIGARDESAKASPPGPGTLQNFLDHPGNAWATNLAGMESSCLSVDKRELVVDAWRMINADASCRPVSR
jgi:hypothetical protein